VSAMGIGQDTQQLGALSHEPRAHGSQLIGLAQSDSSIRQVSTGFDFMRLCGNCTALPLVGREVCASSYRLSLR